MAEVNIGEIISHLDNDLRRALAEAVHREMPIAKFDAHSLFREFEKAVLRKCSMWESVPDQYVKS